MFNRSSNKTILAAMFLCLGLVLPLLTSQIRQFGNMFLPMHIPVLLCGLICGPLYGFLIGAILPVLRSVIFEMPKLYPDAVAMTFELATYGFVIGILYNRFFSQNIKYIYLCLIISMILGRIIWGTAQIILFSLANMEFTFKIFVSGAILSAIPGIILQLILIPAVMMALKKAKFIKTNNLNR